MIHQQMIFFTDFQMSHRKFLNPMHLMDYGPYINLEENIFTAKRVNDSLPTGPLCEQNNAQMNILDL